MAFDNSTRNRLQRLVSDCRDLLTREFDAKLKEIYGIYADEGRVLDLEKLATLDDEKLRGASLLRERINHLASSGGGTPAAISEAVKRLLREQAFTVLNRFAALRMAEERGIIVESVGGGLNSKGFKTYSEVAHSGLGSAYERYRVFLGCMFDEMATDLGVLFDRRSPYGLLFPRENVLLEMFGLLNASEVKQLWKEDEAVGWIYQYFNDPVERKKMRELSAAPRNSRELAVRNQFFTPRYVVEFLTDNTLGRIWYEMMSGATSVKERCRYLVRRPNEVFLKPGEHAPAQPKQDNLSQEELLKQPVFISHHPIKDPRTILMLDPACGSMHFGLYAFDLYEIIYEEAWELEAVTGALALARPAEMKSLRETFATKEEFLRQVPRLIVEHNLHGIDIDPRCTQIAGLSLWLRAQKSWQRLGLKPAERPRITRSNIVCAEPMPGEKELLREFVEKEFPTAERGVFLLLLESIFDKMQLAGEAGSLLKIEEEIKSAIETAREIWLKLQARPKELFSTGELNTVSKQPELTDLEQVVQSAVRNPQSAMGGDFWETAESRIYAALRDYAEQAENGGGFQRRLFAEDAARGFAFIDVCRKRYDVALMNPPFGEWSKSAKNCCNVWFPDAGEDIDAAFVDAGSAMLLEKGMLGVIANRTQFFKGALESWRFRNFLEQAHICALADLGHGVLDGAFVEASAYVLAKSDHNLNASIFFRTLDTEAKEKRLNNLLMLWRTDAFDQKNTFLKTSSFFRALPARRVAYWITSEYESAFKSLPKLEGTVGYARQGLASADNFRFVRLVWEVLPLSIDGVKNHSASPNGLASWYNFAKGGDYSPYFQDLHLVVLWHAHGRELKAFPGSVIRNPTFYFAAAVTYSERTVSGFSPRALPRGCIFDSKGPIIAPAEHVNPMFLLAFLMSRPAASFLEFMVASGDSAVSGTSARQYTQSIVGSVPFPDFSNLNASILVNAGARAWKSMALEDACYETSRFFVPRSLATFSKESSGSSLKTLALTQVDAREANSIQILEASLEIEKVVRASYHFGLDSQQELDESFGKHALTFEGNVQLPSEEFSRLYLLGEDELVDEIGKSGRGGRAVTKKSFFADRRLELLSQFFSASARQLISERKAQSLVRQEEIFEAAAALSSQSLGVAFGRWDIRYVTGEQAAPELPEPFTPLPVCPPGQLQNSQGLPARPEDVPAAYPLKNIPWAGILVDDESHQCDLVARVRQVIEIIWTGSAGSPSAEAIEHEACEILGVRSLRDYFRKPASFFADHLKRYSKSRRQAPIYWPLSTASGSYTLWIYYHRLTDQTLFQCVNDFVKPKITELEGDLSRLTIAGADKPGARVEIERLTTLRAELVEFRDELLRVAQLPYKPNLNDGVLITASPLWKLFRLPKWQKDLKACWTALEEGEYDWAHIAYTLWPDRVKAVCKIDRSIAIAHGLEDLCDVKAPEKKAKKKKKEQIEMEETE